MPSGHQDRSLETQLPFACHLPKLNPPLDKAAPGQSHSEQPDELQDLYLGAGARFGLGCDFVFHYQVFVWRDKVTATVFFQHLTDWFLKWTLFFLSTVWLLVMWLFSKNRQKAWDLPLHTLKQCFAHSSVPVPCTTLPFAWVAHFGFNTAFWYAGFWDTKALLKHVHCLPPCQALVLANNVSSIKHPSPVWSRHETRWQLICCC